jgi:NAD(P)-dependent dehydrogenase (short-subunit alcohol dehydrogenase family)
MTDRPLEGKAALVTGASRGIGKGIALKLAEAGADVLLSARSMDDLEQTAIEARTHGVRAETIRMDAYDLDDVNAAVDAVTTRFGRIDVLVNNAGGSRNVDGGWLGFMESTPRIVRELFELNVFSPYFAAQRAALAMEQQGFGSIINISSPLADYPSARIQPYSIAKMAIQEFTKLWAFELGPKGIRVNAIAPGPIQSAQIEKLIAANPAREQAMIDEVPLGRIGQPADVGAAAVFLASDAAEWISGATLLIAGGKRW